MLMFAVLALGIMLIVAFAQLRPAPYQPLVSRSVMQYPPSLVNHLYARDWTADQFAARAARLHVEGRTREAGYYADFAHIRALEERMENERFVQLAAQRQAKVLARVRVHVA